MTTDSSPSHRSTARHRWGLFGLVVGIVVALGFYAFVGVGWYFSDQIAADALRVDDDPPKYEVEVAAVGDGTITLVLGDDPEDDLLSPDVLGIDSGTGFGQVNGPVERSGETVTRAYAHLSGALPGPGALVDLQGYAFPRDPATGHGIEYFERVYESPFGSFDAWFVPGEDDRWVIMVHGRGADPRELLRMLPAVVEAGHPALVITYRNDPAQPGTDDGYARFGTTEWEDLEGAAQFALDGGASDLVIFGASMGGAIASSFMLESELADEVVGLVFDAPALDLGAMVNDRAADTKLLPPLPFKVPGGLTAFAKWLAAARFDLDWDDLDYLDQFDEIDVPILLYHGDDDGTVTVEIGDDLAAARPDLVTYVRVPGAGHVRAWNADPERYEAALTAFLTGL